MQYIFISNGHRISFDSINKAVSFFGVSKETIKKALYRHSASGFHSEIFTSKCGHSVTADTKLIGNYKQISYIKNKEVFEKFKDSITYFDVNKNRSKGNSKFVYIAKSKDITLMEAGLPNLFRQIFKFEHIFKVRDRIPYNKSFHQLVDLTRWHLKRNKSVQTVGFIITKIT